VQITLGGIETVTISDKELRESGGDKVRQELKSRPSFDTVVEFSSTDANCLFVYENVERKIKDIMLKKHVKKEMRNFYFDENNDLVLETKIE
jgi:hypothetical protein